MKISRLIYCYFIILLTLIYTSVVNNASVGGTKYRKFIGDQGLYKDNDDVEILTVGNFRDAVLGSNQAWLVEFYNSYCGFCQRFAPQWKAFATSIKNWKDLVKVAAIDCAVEANTGLCREFEIMGYPTLRYFYENYKNGSYGEYIDRGTNEEEHRRDLLNTILKYQLQGRSKQFPILSPYNHSDTSKIFENVQPPREGVKYGVLVLQEPNSHVGMEVTMDLHGLPEIVVRYAFSNNSKLLNNLGAKNLPTSFIIKKHEDSVNEKIPAQKDRNGLVTSIVDELKLYGKYYDTLGIDDKSKTNKSKVPSNALVHDELLERVKKMGDVVFQMDLETALRYSLKREVGGTKQIEGEKLAALIQYLDLLQKYFPFGRDGKVLLQNLFQYVQTANPVEGKVIFDKVKEAEQDGKLVFSTMQNWLGCRGSKPHFRGYSCGLWKMFHYLVTNAADGDIRLRGSNPKVALEAMHGYVKNFFGCTDCSQHFQAMAKRREMENVSSFDGSVLWLWMAHNEVNDRLQGEITEDPEFPKIQFPSREKCKKCYKPDGTWNSTDVIQYLKHMYSSININYLGADTRVIHLGLGEGDGTSTKSGGFFKTIDTSMCVLLYVSSFVLLMILIQIFLKRGYRRKMYKYKHDLLGKV